MKLIPGLICAGALWAGGALAQSPVTLTIQAPATDFTIPADFSGLSFETSNLLPDKQGKYLFSAENTELVSLFRTIGIKNLRVGGGTAEIPKYAVPGTADIDKLFGFAQAAGVKVIYTLRLLNGDEASAVALAKYIEEHYRSQLTCLALGNEPDWRTYHNKDTKISDYPSYLNRWREFADAIVAATPMAKFGGPDTGSDYPVPSAVDTDYNGESWTQHFVADAGKSGVIVAAFQHDYIGQETKGVSVATAIDAMLSTNWVGENYPALFNHVLARAQADGVDYRMTECNDYVGGVDGASNAFASALWALDYLHWQAMHHALGVNFHNKRWIFTDTIHPDAAGNFQVNPKAYGIKAFDVGSHGKVQLVSIANPETINLTAYAVRGERELFVTVINKDHGARARGAKVTIVAGGNSRRPETMFLSAPNGEVTAKTGVTLGGAMISNDRVWEGKWMPLAMDRPGQSVVNVAAASAAVVRFETD